MIPINEFPRSVIEKLGFYVYLLIDPRTDKVFYVGKGTGNRIFAHITSAIASPLENDKLAQIRSIKSEGFRLSTPFFGMVLLRKKLLKLKQL